MNMGAKKKVFRSILKIDFSGLMLSELTYIYMLGVRLCRVSISGVPCNKLYVSRGQ